MLSAWQQWCRLCGKTDSYECSIDVESLGSLNFTIQKHFAISVSYKVHRSFFFADKPENTTSNECEHCHFQLSGTDTHASLICAGCYEFIAKLQQFSEQCNKANALFNKILHSTKKQQNDVNHLQTLRYEAGLDEKVTKMDSIPSSKCH